MESLSGSEVTMDQSGLSTVSSPSTSTNTSTSTSTKESSSTSTIAMLKMFFLLLLMPVSSIMGKYHLIIKCFNKLTMNCVLVFQDVIANHSFIHPSFIQTISPNFIIHSFIYSLWWYTATIF